MRRSIYSHLWLSALISFAATTSSSAQYGEAVATAEAEDGVLTGVTVASSGTGFSGTGFVTGFDNTGDEVTVAMDVPETGFYKLVIRYNGPGGDKYQDVIVNGGFAAPVSFPATQGYADTDAGNYTLPQGRNTFTVRKNWGWSDIDRFSIHHAEKNNFNVAPDPVDPAATPETKALFHFILSQFGNHIISGQTHDYFDDLKTITGKTPLIRNGELYSYTEGYPYVWKNGGHSFGKFDNGTVHELIEWYDSTQGRGIVAFQWHWCSPSGGSPGTNTFYTSQTNFDVTKAVTPGTQEYSDIIRDIDDIAAELKKFRDAHIPVLWRPLHEAGGGWFWWGAKGPEACVKLYNIMYDRLMNYHQLHNLIWVWSTPETAWYPGNDKVDIIGYDSYPGDFNYGAQKYWFDVLYRLTGGNKIIAMTENGPVPDPALCFGSDAPWAYFMTWGNLVTQQNSAGHLRQVYSDPYVLTLESEDLPAVYPWRSSLYPEDWKPGYKDEHGNFLHDFSYAGYHRGESAIPIIKKNIVDVTSPPYNADNTGNDDVTPILQQALDDVGSSGGGVVWLPTGTYRIKIQAGQNCGLRIRFDSTILRGAGYDSTFIFHDETSMRLKDIIQVYGDYAGWRQKSGAVTYITADLNEPTCILPVVSTEGFNAGDLVVVRATPTEAFIEEHKMGGIWTPEAFEGLAFLRRIDSVDVGKNILIIDAPTRYYLTTRDSARVYHARKHITECGIEDLSIGNRENTKTGWEDEDYDSEGTGAWDVHFSHVIRFHYGLNCWVKKVHTYRPSVNSQDVHLLSNCLSLVQCRFITIDSCDFQKPLYEGGGGNGYMYTLESNDCLVSNSRGNDGRHNFDFKYPYSNGNVILNCRAENSRYASDFHMYLSMANLFDACTVNGDLLESVFRPYGGDAIHGYSGTQSVFYNTRGEAWHQGKNFIIDSRQFGRGYVIGTSGPADGVNLDPVSGSLNGYSFDTSPKDFLEGQGRGEGLTPASLYRDQLARRLARMHEPRSFDITIIIEDKSDGTVIPGCRVMVYNSEQTSDETGKARFSDVYRSFILSIDKPLFEPLQSGQVIISSDTTLTFSLSRKTFHVSLALTDSLTGRALEGTEIVLGDSSVVTDAKGEATLQVRSGDNNYTLSLGSYRSLTGSVRIVYHYNFR